MSEQIFAVTRERVEELKALLSLDRSTLTTLAARSEARTDPRQRGESGGTISVIPVYGFIEQRQSVLGAMFGGTSTQWISSVFRAAMADPNVKAIILDVSSGGGSVFGVTELANEIMAARGQKPIVAQVNSMAASAAYWIASAADEVVSSPSGLSGSIGVFAVHQDYSEAEAKAGIKTSIIAAGEHKADAVDGAPLSDAGRASMQAMVDHIYLSFLTDVAMGRQVSVAKVKADFGKGLVFTAPTARAAGMVDRIETMDATVKRLSTAQGRAAVARSLYNGEAERRLMAVALMGDGDQEAAKQRFKTTQHQRLAGLATPATGPGNDPGSDPALLKKDFELVALGLEPRHVEQARLRQGRNAVTR